MQRAPCSESNIWSARWSIRDSGILRRFQPSKLILVHGEEYVLDAFANRIRDDVSIDAHIAKLGETVEVQPGRTVKSQEESIRIGPLDSQNVEMQNQTPNRKCQRTMVDPEDVIQHLTPKTSLSIQRQTCMSPTFSEGRVTFNIVSNRAPSQHKC